MQKVSERMTRNFARIKCKGRLELAEEGENYKEYGLNIVVRFQNNTAERELTMDNSGGGSSTLEIKIFWDCKNSLITIKGQNNF